MIIVCAVCGKPATCIGDYRDSGEPAPACDECCGHGNEDGWCRQLKDILGQYVKTEDLPSNVVRMSKRRDPEDQRAPLAEWKSDGLLEHNGFKFKELEVNEGTIGYIDQGVVILTGKEGGFLLTPDVADRLALFAVRAAQMCRTEQAAYDSDEYEEEENSDDED